MLQYIKLLSDTFTVPGLPPGIFTCSRKMVEDLGTLLTQVTIRIERLQLCVEEHDHNMLMHFDQVSAIHSVWLSAMVVLQLSNKQLKPFYPFSPVTLFM